VAGFKELWMSGEYSDFTIIAGKEEFAVHKNVLATQSPVLAAIFKNDMKEKKTGKMIIEDFSLDAVEVMLYFMYTGEIVDESNAMDLYAIASKYEVTSLKSTAHKLILRNLGESNAIEIFGLGHQHNSDRIKRAAFEVIKKMFPWKVLEDELMEDPKTLKKLIDAARKIQEGQAEIDKLLPED
jgi:BTB/POZ domain